MKAQYIRAMDALHRACVFVAGACLVVITVIIPYGVFTRYVLNSASSLAGADGDAADDRGVRFSRPCVCYREYLHIGVGVLPAFLPTGQGRNCSAGSSKLCMLATNLFMAGVGHRARADRPGFRASPNSRSCRVGLAYLPIRSAAALTVARS